MDTIRKLLGYLNPPILYLAGKVLIAVTIFILLVLVAVYSFIREQPLPVAETPVAEVISPSSFAEPVVFTYSPAPFYTPPSTTPVLSNPDPTFSEPDRPVVKEVTPTTQPPAAGHVPDTGPASNGNISGAGTVSSNTIPITTAPVSSTSVPSSPVSTPPVLPATPIIASTTPAPTSPGVLSLRDLITLISNAETSKDQNDDRKKDKDTGVNNKGKKKK